MSADTQPTVTNEVLRVRDLGVAFRTEGGLLQAVRGVTWEVRRGETLVILGESGSGKSVSLHAVGGLLPPNASVTGSIDFLGRELVGMRRREMRRIQASDVGVVFQDPLSSLNPCFTIADQIGEIFRVHRGLRRAEAHERAVDLLDLVRIPEPRRRAGQYPHELSGGMRQRAVIAMAIALDPPLLLADEPTTALDTTVRGSILTAIQEMRDRLGIAVVLITHDIGVAAAVADRVAVMYAGKVVEQGPVRDVLLRPSHPYTAALLESMPRLERRGEDLHAIRGTPPSLRSMPAGCAFAPRCEHALDLCRDRIPGLVPLGSGRASACHRVDDLRAAGVLRG